MSADLSRVLFIPHGAGPLPLLGDQSHQALCHFFQNVRPRLGTPAAILVVSAHWEAPVATVTGSQHPQLLYDYQGFPQESYTIQYPVPGAPNLASEVLELLQQQGIQTRIDTQRGLDHGVFVPLKLLFPEADLPCVQLSLLKNLQPPGAHQPRQGAGRIENQTSAHYRFWFCIS